MSFKMLSNCLSGSLLLSVALFTFITGNSTNKATGLSGHCYYYQDDRLSQDKFAKGVVINHITCTSKPGLTFALYIPVNNTHQSLPVIYFFDPHGDGALPINKYKKLAEKYGFILLGSNDSKNGNDWSVTEVIWSALSSDAKKRLPIDDSRQYTIGFSGGAKVAGYIALHYPEIKGVIAGGASMPEGVAPGNYPFSFTALAGEGDMNMTGIAGFSTALNQTATRHRIIYFDGIHEWAPFNTMDIALAGLQFDAMFAKQIPTSSTSISAFVAAMKSTIAAEMNFKNFVRAQADCAVAIALLNGITNEVSFFIQQEREINGNALYQKQSQQRQQIMQNEERLKSVYQQQFQKGDQQYWKGVINELNANAKRTTPEKAMYQRLIAYLSLAFYSISNQLIAQHQDLDARHFVDLYKLVDPDNSEAWYFSAVLNARNHNANATKDDLLKSVAKGFNDKARLKQQQEFQPLTSIISQVDRSIKP